MDESGAREDREQLSGNRFLESFYYRAKFDIVLE